LELSEDASAGLAPDCGASELACAELFPTLASLCAEPLKGSLMSGCCAGEDRALPLTVEGFASGIFGSVAADAPGSSARTAGECEAAARAAAKRTMATQWNRLCRNNKPEAMNVELSFPSRSLLLGLAVEADFVNYVLALTASGSNEAANLELAPRSAVSPQ
jgi:hypothetical protein